MANIKVSEMTEATSFDDGDYTMIVQANQNKKISKENILGNIENGISVLTNQVLNITGQILWTNSNPTSEFSAQTITLSSSDYDLLEVFYKKTKDDMFVNSTRFFKGTCSLLFQIDNSFVIFERTISDATDTTLTFTEGKIYTTQGTITTQNSRCIPLYIIGYKTGLFNNEGE